MLLIIYRLLPFLKDEFTDFDSSRKQNPKDTARPFLTCRVGETKKLHAAFFFKVESKSIRKGKELS